MSIVINALCVRFDDLTVFDDFSVTFEDGHKYLLSSPSGTGKTTLCNIVTGLLKPTSGTVDCTNDRFAVVFQEDRLIDELSAIDNVRVVNPHVSNEKIREELEALLPDADLTEPVKNYSGGMRRRVAIVRAMVNGAPVIIADEPLTGLDKAACESTVQYILSRSQGKTLIVASHNPIWAEYCEKIDI